MDRASERHGGRWRLWLAAWTWSTLAVLGITAILSNATSTVPVLTAWSTTLAAWSVSLLCLILVDDFSSDGPSRSTGRPWDWGRVGVPAAAALGGPVLIGAGLIPWNHVLTPLGYLLLCAAVTGFGTQWLGDRWASLTAVDRPADALPPEPSCAADEVATDVAAVVALSECADAAAAKDQPDPDVIGSDLMNSDVIGESASIPVTEQTSQWMARTELEPGVECVEGAVRVHFAIGQTRTAAHVAFAPPLSSVPEVEVECVGDADLRIRLTAIQTYGLRIEAQRSGAHDELTESIAFSALATRRESHAA